MITIFHSFAFRSFVVAINAISIIVLRCFDGFYSSLVRLVRENLNENQFLTFTLCRNPDAYSVLCHQYQFFSGLWVPFLKTSETCSVLEVLFEFVSQQLVI